MKSIRFILLLSAVLGSWGYPAIYFNDSSLLIWTWIPCVIILIALSMLISFAKDAKEEMKLPKQPDLGDGTSVFQEKLKQKMND